jgi:hypothetical protein
MTPNIELRAWSGCPSHPAALAALHEQLESLGHAGHPVTVTWVETDEDALHLGFPGSPTIVVDGQDVEPVEAGPRGLSCRVYRRADGRASPLPDPQRLRIALQRAFGNEPEETP